MALLGVGTQDQKLQNASRYLSNRILYRKPGTTRSADEALSTNCVLVTLAGEAPRA